MPNQADFQRLMELSRQGQKQQKGGGGISEPVLSLITGAFAEPVSGYAGLVTLPFGADKAAAAVEKTRDALTYTPQTQAGRQNMQSIGQTVKSGLNYARMPAAGYGGLVELMMGNGVDSSVNTIDRMRNQGVGQVMGDATFEATGSPFISSLMKAAPEAAVELAGMKGAGRAVPGRDYQIGDVSSVTKGPGGRQRGVFAGVRAKNADLDALEQAKRLKERGASRDEIWKDSGWFQDVDGHWKFEIDDSQLGFKEPATAPQRSLPELDRQLQRYKQMDAEELGLEAELMEFGGSIDDYRAKRIADVQAAKNSVDPSSQYQAAELIGAEDLYDAYPLQRLMFRFPKPDQFRNPRNGGSFDPSTNQIRITAGGSDPRSVALHELQHFIQKQEGFPSGGGAEVAPAILNQYEKAAKAPLQSQKSQFTSLSRQIGDLSQAEYAAKLQKIVESNNIKPSSVRNLSDYYRYSDDLSRNFGAMPSKPGQARDEWLRNAAGYIRRKNMEGVYDDRVRNAGPSELPQLKKEVRRLERQRDKYTKGARQWNEIDRKIKALKEKSDYELYERISGEAEARNVQTRRDMTLEERRQRPPWQTLDVPEEELIFRKR